MVAGRQRSRQVAVTRKVGGFKSDSQSNWKFSEPGHWLGCQKRNQKTGRCLAGNLFKEVGNIRNIRLNRENNSCLRNADRAYKALR